MGVQLGDAKHGPNLGKHQLGFVLVKVVGSLAVDAWSVDCRPAHYADLELLLVREDLTVLVVSLTENSNPLAPETALSVHGVEGGFGDVGVEGGTTTESFFLSRGAVDVS